MCVQDLIDDIVDEIYPEIQEEILYQLRYVFICRNIDNNMLWGGIIIMQIILLHL